MTASVLEMCRGIGSIRCPLLRTSPQKQERDLLTKTLTVKLRARLELSPYQGQKNTFPGPAPTETEIIPYLTPHRDTNLCLGGVCGGDKGR
ncbi:hypothetical protein AVEN_97091-1 [Araneus ventricosus]|uniref:Uncharacterized protein n=1 Tax=Araneus ventricosus TaxID=182803 RepID=A0A4Y2EHM3_ARAVE|nr:hypothetical protein AVEN_97091-1 [Araneus ventricosus]